VQFGVSDMFGIRIYSEDTGTKPLGFAMVNDNYASMNANGSRVMFTSVNTDPDDAMTPAKLIAGTWVGG